MKTTKSALLISCLILILSCACRVTNAQDLGHESARFVLSKTTFQSTQNVTARFENVSNDTIYIINFGDCSSTLEKLQQGKWTRLFRPDIASATVVSSWPFEPGRVEQLMYTLENLKRLVQEPEGRYRFVRNVAPIGDYNGAEQIISETFVIEE